MPIIKSLLAFAGLVAFTFGVLVQPVFAILAMMAVTSLWRRSQQ